MKEINPDLSIVIPCLNEGKNLEIVVRDIVNTLKSIEDAPAYELLIINDGSTDDTGERAEQLAKNISQVRVFNHETPHGYGGALGTGFSNAKGKYTTMLPGDGEIPATEAMKLYRLSRQTDLVVGRRKPLDDNAVKNARPWTRRSLSAVLRYLTILFLGINPEGKEGIFLIRTDILHRMRPISKTGLLQFEIFSIYFRDHPDYSQAELLFKERLSGSSKVANISNILKYLRELVKVCVFGRILRRNIIGE